VRFGSVLGLGRAAVGMRRANVSNTSMWRGRVVPFLGSTVRAGAPAVLRGRDLLDARGMGVLDWIFRKFACRL
jgi:hypothetical protein